MDVKGFLRLFHSGTKEINLGDIKSPKLKRGPAPKPKATPVNEINLSKASDDLPIGDMSSQQMPYNELNLGDITDPTLKKGRAAAGTSIEPNPRDLPISRKKLQEVDSSSSEIPYNEYDMGSPTGNLNVDDPRLPVSSHGLDVVGGNKVPASRRSTNIGSEARVPAHRTQTMPEEVGIKVYGKGGGSKSVKPETIIDAEIIDKVDNKAVKEILEKNKGRSFSDLLKSPTAKRTLIAAGVLTGAGVGYNALQSTETSPSAKFIAPDIIGSKEALAEENQVAQKDRELAKGQQTKKIEDVDKLVESLQDKEDDQEAKSNRLDYMNLMMNAQQAASQNSFANAILKAGIQAGNAISRSGKEADYTVADELAKTADAPVENVKKLVETDASSKKLQQIQEEMTDEAKMRDPNSEISKFYRAQYGSFFPNLSPSASAFAMNKVAPILSQLHMTREAAESRKQARAEASAEKEERNKEINKFKAQTSVDKQVSQLYKSKDYEAYNAAKDAQVALDAAIASGDKTEAGTAFMQFGKIAQGDNSVLRDGDMIMLAGGYDYTSVGDMLSKLRAKAAGGNFNDKELKQMRKVSEKVQQLKGERVQQLVSPIIERIKANDLNLLEHFDPAQIEEFTNKSDESTSKYSEKEEAGIANYMRVKGLSREEAVSQLRAGGRLK